MTMIIADTQLDMPRMSGATRFAFTVLATALITLIVVPALALSVSYFAGGAATSTILLVYLFPLLSNGVFVVAGLAAIVGVITMPKAIFRLVGLQHA